MRSAPQRVAVIGAGAAGLSAARHLLEAGHQVVVFEKGSHVGGLWVYNNDNQLSAAYASLHINSEPRVTHYRGLPFADSTSLFPSHREVTEYLNSVADHCDIRRHIRFNTPVAQVVPTSGVAGGTWTVRLGDASEEEYDAVVVATGHQGSPAHPEWAGRFAGEYLHSHGYRVPQPFSGKRVLVVGVGNSGLDIAADLAPVAATTYVSARSPVLIMPRMIFGVPSARIIAKLNRPFLPWVVQRQVLRSLSRIFHGRMEDWGFVTPKTRTHPASNATFMAHVAYRKILAKPGVADVSGTTVTFANGESVDVDVVFAATGYEIDLPFLGPETSPVVDRRLEAYKRIVHPRWPGLYFIGFFNVSGGANISMMDVQSAWMAKLVSGEVGLPSEQGMRADIAAERAFLARRYPNAPRYGLELDPVRYRREMAEALRAPAGPAAQGSRDAKVTR